MTAAGNPWAPSQPPIELVAKDGREISLTICEYGAELSDGGGMTVLAHVVEDPADPDRLQIAGRWFRAEGA